MIPVETVYRARIDYDVDGADRASIDKLDRIAAYASNVGDSNGVNVDCASGGPCWNAYLVFEGADRDMVQRVANNVAGYVKKFRGGKILD